MLPKYGTNTHYGCGHERTKENSVSAGSERWRCKKCVHERKRRLKIRKEDGNPLELIK